VRFTFISGVSVKNKKMMRRRRIHEEEAGERL
jgi:hypothetical protein